METTWKNIGNMWENHINFYMMIKYGDNWSWENHRTIRGGLSHMFDQRRVSGLVIFFGMIGYGECLELSLKHIKTMIGYFLSYTKHI